MCDPVSLLEDKRRFELQQKHSNTTAGLPWEKPEEGLDKTHIFLEARLLLSVSLICCSSSTGSVDNS
ncbi:hypothetical protein CAEBREN_20041 [Caenorhabditis brenneri]|uniref:Uncharacterized protein n=1 Tax=Caenorhabditis brenneri TaxID=135651 RepID=G0MR52_CAEBE|nr:hypothetical protein CAEBREN_20041 [Caenorhabditis brenneri]